MRKNWVIPAVLLGMAVFYAVIAIGWWFHLRARASGVQINAAPNVNGDQIQWSHGTQPEEPRITFQGDLSNGLMRDASGAYWLVCQGRIIRQWTEPVPANSEALRKLNPCGAKP